MGPNPEPNASQGQNHDAGCPTPICSRKSRPRSGNWICSACGFLNFHYRIFCLRCMPTIVLRPGDERNYSSVSSQSATIRVAYQSNHYRNAYRNRTRIVNSRTGDWICGNVLCGYHNLARNCCCRRCGGHPPGAGKHSRETIVPWILRPYLVAALCHKYASWLNVIIASTDESFRYRGYAATQNRGEPMSLSSDFFFPRLESWNLPVPQLPAVTLSQSFACHLPLPGPMRTLESQIPTPSLDQPLKFGCPFHKAYPYRFPSCKERSLKDTSRVKEHIYRSHLVFQCQRCGDTFPEEMALGKHLRSNPACESVDHAPVEYAINQEQREILRSRKGLKGTSEPDRWLQIYKMVCPEAIPPYPSPYTNPKSTNETLQEFANFAHQEMPSLINAEINTLSSRDIISLDDTSRQAIQNIMRKVLDNLLDRFESGRPSPTLMPPAQSQQEDVGALKNTVGDFNFDFDFDFSFSMDVGNLGTPGHSNLNFMTEEMVDVGTSASSSHKRTLDSDAYDDLNPGLGCNKRRS